MDLNSRIIKAVRDCPLLYKTNSTISQRERGWKLLAEQTQLQEQFLKSRWHFLRDQYGRVQQEHGGYFKYKDEMAFLLPHMPVHRSATVIEPEFVITQKDIEHDSDNEEYMFLEVEALEVSNEEEQQKEEVAEQLNDQQLRHQLEEEESIETTPMDIKLELEQETQNHTVTQQNTKIGQNQTEIKFEKEVHMRDKKQQKQRRLEKQEQQRLEKQEQQGLEKQAHERLEQDDQKGLVQEELKQQEQRLKQQEQEQQQRQQTEEVAHAKQPNTDIELHVEKFASGSNARCEDDIFGELVAAMLKRMSADKKRAVKKDIMNLLLT